MHSQMLPHDPFACELCNYCLKWVKNGYVDVCVCHSDGNQFSRRDDAPVFDMSHDFPALGSNAEFPSLADSVNMKSGMNTRTHTSIPIILQCALICIVLIQWHITLSRDVALKVLKCVCVG